MTPQALKNMHLPLPDVLYRRLRSHSVRSKRPATVLAREAIAQWLDEKDRMLLDQALDAYISEAAGTVDDLDPDLEAAGLECLSRLDQ